MSYKVMITMNNRPPSEITLNVIRDAGMVVEYANCTTENEVITAARDADVLLVGTTPHTTRMVLEALPGLKMVGRSGVGVDSVDLGAATELGICVTNTPGINTSEVADHAMAMLLSITRKIPEQNAALKSGAWSDRPDEINRLRSQLRRIAGNTVGIFGLGNIGKAFATRIRGFGPEKIIAYDPYVDAETLRSHDVEPSGLQERFAQAARVPRVYQRLAAPRSAKAGHHRRVELAAHRLLYMSMARAAEDVGPE